MSLMVLAPINMQRNKMNKACYYPGWIDGFGQGNLMLFFSYVLWYTKACLKLVRIQKGDKKR